MFDAKCATTLAGDDVGGIPGPVEHKGYISAVTLAVDKHAAFSLSKKVRQGHEYGP
jgi:hypothetical protein